MKKLGSKGLVLVLVAVVLLLAGAGVYAMGKKDDAAAPVATTEAADTPSHSSDMTFDNATLPKDPLGERSLGDPKAPVKIVEYASLTCSHCAHFEATTFPELKKKYIDTGKVFYTFVDFPLNAPALDAAMLARCLPPERYFPFIVMLFASQDQWAFGQDYKSSLRQNAKLAGLTDEKHDSCLADKNLKEGVIKAMQEGQGKGIDSTPSFLINGSVVKGALGIEAFDKAIADAELKTTGEKK